MHWASAAFAFALFLHPLAAATIPEGASPSARVTLDSKFAVIARHSKSADSRYALVWTVKDDDAVDWRLLESDPTAFYEKHEVREIWVADLARGRNLHRMAGAGAYLRPGSHRTLTAAWGAEENGRRFALAAYDWKWGTDTLFLLDVSAEEASHTDIGAVIDEAVETFLRRKTTVEEAQLDTHYTVGGLPERGRKTGFSAPDTVQVPFTTRMRGKDRVFAAGVVTLRLTRAGGKPVASVLKVSGQPAASEPFEDDAALAKADRELNAAYTALRQSLTQKAREDLKTEQRAWIAERDREAAGTEPGPGESRRIMRDRILTRLTKARAAELRQRLGKPAR